MNMQEITINLNEIIRRWCNANNYDYYAAWKHIHGIAEARGLEGKPMEAVGWLLSAKDILPLI